MRLGPAIIAMMAAGALLAACGDDDDDEALSKPQYIAKGDAICAKANQEFEQLFEAQFPTTRAAIPDFFKKATVVVRNEVTALRELDEPEADKARIEKMLARGDRAVKDFERASTDPEFGAQLFSQEGGKNAAAFDKEAKAYGFTKCDEDEEEDEREAKVDRSAFSADKKAYIAKADAVCRKGNAKFSALERRYLKSFPPPLDVWARFLPAITEVGRAQLADLEEITPPAADSAKIEQLLRRQEELIGQFEKAGETAAAKDEQGFQQASGKMFSAGDELDEDLRAYGFQECGSEEED